MHDVADHHFPIFSYLHSRLKYLMTCLEQHPPFLPINGTVSHAAVGIKEWGTSCSPETDEFSPANLIGTGHFGSVFKWVILGSTEPVVVKNMELVSNHPHKETSTLMECFSLEMFTGKRPTEEVFQDGRELHQFCKIGLHKQAMKIIDSHMLELEREGNDRLDQDIIGDQY
ncbi:hypothetical protein Syun_031441 [Stephania yunnanensis]|uniref:Protein kinase domain-containing protein n=1 Tax=Stephania yunnanensis TaxID=152371 RepID=A0AAP0DZI9_9MAGN